MLKCPKCGCQEHVKNGKIFGKQRYRCKNPSCKANYTRCDRHHGTKNLIRARRKAFGYYMDGWSLSKISKQLKVSRMAVSYWFKDLRKKLIDLDNILEKEYFPKQKRIYLNQLNQEIKRKGISIISNETLRDFDTYREEIRTLID